MLIGIDASRANSDHKSGTEWYSYYIIRWLAKLDSKNEYILYSDRPITGGLLDLTTKVHFAYYQDKPIKFDKNGYQIIRSPHKNFKAKILKWPFKNFWTLGRLTLEMILHKPDVLFVPSHALPLINPRNTINTIHDIAFERDSKIYSKDIGDGLDEKKKNLLNFIVKVITLGKYQASNLDYLRFSSKFALKHAKRIISVSEFTKNELINIYKADADKIQVIHNGYSRSWFNKIDNPKKIINILNKYDITCPYLLYVGRLERKKNTPGLIEAFALAKEGDKSINHKLVLVGDASYGYDEVNYVSQEYKIDNQIISPGWIVEDDLPYIFNGASAFIFPSKHEGFGIPILQAMACQVPVACSDIEVLREVAQDSALFFDPNDTCAISYAIKKILTDEKLREELIEKGKKRSQQFSWEESARKTLELINNLPTIK